MHIPFPLIFALALIVAITLALTSKGKPDRSKKTYRYQLQNALTENEQAMYWKLTAALPGHVVLAQVSVTSVIKGKDLGSYGTIAQSSFDFVVCTKDFKAVAAIEIDDKTHERPDRQKADATKQKACDAAGLKLIRWKSHRHPTTEEIAGIVSQI